MPSSGNATFAPRMVLLATVVLLVVAAVPSVDATSRPKVVQTCAVEVCIGGGLLPYCSGNEDGTSVWVETGYGGVILYYPNGDGQTTHYEGYTLNGCPPE